MSPPSIPHGLSVGSVRGETSAAVKTGNKNLGVLMLELTMEQVHKIQQALSQDKRKEVVIKVENGRLVVLCVHKQRIG